MKRRSVARIRRVAVAAIATFLVTSTLGATAFATAPDVADPWEGFNRAMFRFNEGADKWVVGPIAKGWDFIFPDPVERAIDRFFENASFPIRFVNDVLQAKPIAAGEDLSRFVINTTIGVAGFFDVAKKFGLKNHKEDFGQTLGYWGVPPGPYLVMPLLGPSNPRDLVGLVADSAARVYPYFVVWWISSAVTTTDLINSRSLIDDTLTAERAAALDFYVAQRNAYMQYREEQIRDQEGHESPSDEDLYYPDDGGGEE